MNIHVQIIRGIILSLAMLFVNSLDAQNIHLRVVNTQGEPQFGVYVINQKNHYLLTTTDIDGECIIKTDKLESTDSLLFQGMEYQTLTYQLKDLLSIHQVVLTNLKYELAETIVQGITMKELFKKTTSKLKKGTPDIIPLCKAYGNARYEKITTCLDTTVEYRREYGYYFTSGDIRSRDVWDNDFRSYFVPKFIARSFNFTYDRSTTLSPSFITDEEVRYDIGTRKIFTLMRSIQLFAPLFNDTRYYDIYPLDSDNTDYLFAFKTKSSAYPQDTRLSCKGTFTIDAESHELKTMNFDYVDYQLLRQVLLSKHRKVNSPFSTKAQFTFAYTPSHEYYIQSCIQETTWKYNLGDNFIVIEQPSRPNPAESRLVEKEAFYCEDYRPIPRELQTNRILSKIHLAQRYLIGVYDQEVFEKLPLLLDNTKAIHDLNTYQDIEEQYEFHSNLPYYPNESIIRPINEITTLKNQHDNLIIIRQEVLELGKRLEDMPL